MENRINSLHFDNFIYSDGHFRYSFILDDEKIELDLTHSVASSLPLETINRIGFNLGMCYLLDLAEIVLARHLYVYRPLDPIAFEYWRQLYDEQLIEKCYALKLPTALKNVEWHVEMSSIHNESPLTISGERNHAALCLTGGKESLSILKTLEGKKDMMLFFLDLETNVHRQDVLAAVKDDHFTVYSISNRKKLFAPYEAKYGGLQCGVDMAHLVLNTMLFADKCEYVLIGNEYSANYPNDVYEGSVVNHQFVKTVHFAENLNRYVHAFITRDFTYYSPFFGIYEYKIAELLFKDDKYLDVWTSCNQHTPEVNFCSNCAKCAFTYLLARTKKSKDYLDRFFTRDILQDIELYKPLMDFVGKKPLDCVGDKTEVWVALEDLLNQGVRTAVIDYYEYKIRPIIVDELPDYIDQINSAHRVPVDFPDEIKAVFYEDLQLNYE